METIKLEVNSKIYDKLMGLLRQFQPEDLRIIDERIETQKFRQEKKYLDEQLELIDSGKAEFLSIEQFNQLMEDRIKRYESKDS